MSTRHEVTTWADGFGTWHARVDTHESILSDVAAKLARSAITAELEQRETNLAPVRVALVSRTSCDGVLSSEYVETETEEQARNGS